MYNKLPSRDARMRPNSSPTRCRRTSERRTTCYSRGGDAPGIDSTVGTLQQGLAVQDVIVLRHTEGFSHFFSLRVDCA